jgi:Major Facilitator Superfamily
LDTGPLLTGLVQVIGLKRTILACMGLLAAGTGLSLFMTAPWQLFITWGLMVGIGAGGGAVGVAAAIANRWFVARSGLAMGLLSAANAAGQLAFLPLLALLAEQYGWQGVAVAVTVAIAAMVPVVAILLPESPADIGLGPYGATADRGRRAPSGNPIAIAMTTLFRAARSLDFWLLTLSFGICGFTTNGLINTHLIAFCADHGIGEVTGASILATLGEWRHSWCCGSPTRGLFRWRRNDGPRDRPLQPQFAQPSQWTAAQPAHAAVFCVDEKTATQALERKDPVLPLSPDREEPHGSEYYRHGDGAIPWVSRADRSPHPRYRIVADRLHRAR